MILVNGTTFGTSYRVVIKNEEVAHAVGGVLVDRIRGMAVTVCNPDIGVPERLLHDRERDALLEHDGRRGVPHRVQPVVQKILGHSDSRVTERYVHVAEAQMKEAAGRMSRMLRRGADAPKNGPIRDGR